MSTPHDDAVVEHIDLLDLLGTALDRVEPVPSRLLEVAYGARLLSTLDAELAELVFDSRTQPQPAMRNGSESESRFLSFANENLTVDLSLSPDGRTIVGEIDPAVARELSLEVPGAEPVTVPIDQFGRFTVSSDAVSFRLRIAGYLVTPGIAR